MRRLAQSVAFSAALLIGCNEPEPGGASMPSSTAPPPASSVKRTIAEVPTTSKSDEAIQAFRFFADGLEKIGMVLGRRSGVPVAKRGRRSGDCRQRRS